jgi:hypothetical protein
MEGGIEDMKKAGFGYEIPPMAQLHQAALLGYYQAKRYDDALKTPLKLYYLIQPMQNPPLLEMNRIDTMYHLMRPVRMVGERRIPIMDNLLFNMGRPWC